MLCSFILKIVLLWYFLMFNRSFLNLLYMHIEILHVFNQFQKKNDIEDQLIKGNLFYFSVHWEQLVRSFAFSKLILRQKVKL